MPRHGYSANGNIRRPTAGRAARQRVKVGGITGLVRSLRGVVMQKILGSVALSPVLALLAGTVAGAEAEPRETQGWLVGIGYVIAPDPYAGDVATTDKAIPLIGYVGERLTWLGPYLSYELVETGRMNLDVVLAVRFEGIEEDVSSGPLTGVQAREPALEAGVDAGYGPLLASLRADASGQHNGYEVSLSLGEDWYPAARWRLEGRAGIAWQDAKLTSHFYGVDATEAGPGLAAYEPDAALNVETSLGLSRQVGNRWRVFTSVTYEAFDGEIGRSPIVDQDYQFSAFAGVTYHFGKRPSEE
jgi:outer membrane protein